MAELWLARLGALCLALFLGLPQALAQPAPAPGPAKTVSILFPTNKTSVGPDADMFLPDILAAVAANAPAKIVVHGYATPQDVYDGDTHRVGDVEAFSLRRAQAMADYLRAHGLAAIPIAVEGDGATHLLAPLSPGSDYAAPDNLQDRRVDVVITRR
jgi:outer membrane protein OmpA-like peptidoglycan-associated protein